MGKFDHDGINTAMPPHCTLIEYLCKRKDNPDIREDEINLIVEFDGLITYDLDGCYIDGIAIGCYTMPVLREVSERFGSGDRIEIVELSKGFAPAYQRRVSTKALGNFLRHAGNEESGFNRRSKRVHDLYEVYNRSIADYGQAECLNDIWRIRLFVDSCMRELLKSAKQHSSRICPTTASTSTLRATNPKTG
jgi:hypothetical protein